MGGSGRPESPDVRATMTRRAPVSKHSPRSEKTGRHPGEPGMRCGSEDDMEIPNRPGSPGRHPAVSSQAPGSPRPESDGERACSRPECQLNAQNSPPESLHRMPRRRRDTLPGASPGKHASACSSRVETIPQLTARSGSCRSSRQHRRWAVSPSHLQPPVHRKVPAPLENFSMERARDRSSAQWLAGSASILPPRFSPFPPPKGREVRSFCL